MLFHQPKQTKKSRSFKTRERNGDVGNIRDGGSIERDDGETLQEVEEREPCHPGSHWSPHPKCHHSRRRMGLSRGHQDLGLHMRYYLYFLIRPIYIFQHYVHTIKLKL